MWQEGLTQCEYIGKCGMAIRLPPTHAFTVKMLVCLNFSKCLPNAQLGTSSFPKVVSTLIIFTATCLLH